MEQPLLNDREQEVFKRVLLGQSNQEIANSLQTTVGTVKTDLRTIVNTFQQIGIDLSSFERED